MTSRDQPGPIPHPDRRPAAVPADVAWIEPGPVEPGEVDDQPRWGVEGEDAEWHGTVESDPDVQAAGEPARTQK